MSRWHIGHHARGGRRRRAARAALLGLTVVAALTSPVTAGAASITFTAPQGALSYPDQSMGPVGYSEAPLAFRTTDTRPTIGIQADGGAQLQCHFDSVFVTQPCGGPAPGCPAVCGSFQPAAPLGPDSEEFSRTHFLAVDLVDADGTTTLASTWVNLDIDTTPPVTQLDSARGVLTDEKDAPLHPAFSYTVTDSNSVGTNVDAVACAWGPVATTPSFAACGAGGGTHTIAPGRLPARHRLYRLQVRGTDDFGRSTTASGVYDPVPCVLSIRRPAGIGGLLGSGIWTRLTCDTLRHATVAVYAFMVNGRRATTPRGAVSDNPILGEYRVSNATGPLTASRRLRLSGAARGALRQAASVGLVIAAGDTDKVVSGLADDSIAYQVLTLRR